MKCIVLLFALLVSLTACASDFKQPPRPKLPYNAWYIGLAAPKHMEVWVEDVNVLDRRGLAFFHVFGGVASYTGKVKGCHQGAGATKSVSNVELPGRIYLRWQSLVEPQTYMIDIAIPQWVRDEMLKSERVYCRGSKRWKKEFRDIVSLGMAPSGIVKVWNGGPCLGFKDVGRYQAKIDPRGPNRDGNYIYHRPPNPKAQAYIDKYGIPYGSW